jgi:methyl-accepting chemotaxis protein
MKKMSVAFFGILAISSALSLAEISFAFVWFRMEGVSIAHPIGIVLGSGLFFVAAIMALIGRRANLYDVDFSELQKDTAKYREKLIAIGNLPLQSLTAFVLIQTIYLAVLFAVPGLLPIRDGDTIPVFIMILSLGMLNSAMVFVFADSLITRALLAQQLSTYPEDLREDRQTRKTFIIPMFMTIMALAFAFSITYLMLRRGDGQLGGLHGDTIFVGIGTTILYLSTVTALVLIWNHTTARIYLSIIRQLDALNSADKDLRSRIFITSVDELGTLAGLTNNFCSGLETDIFELKNVQHTLTETGKELQENAETSGAAVNQITGGISRLRERTGAQSTSVGEASVAVRQIAKNIESLDGMIANQAASISEASSSVEEMVGTISSINSSIERMAKQFDQLALDATNGSGIQNAAGGKIGTIVERSNALQEANKVVAAIAAQTNLLAMNAAIEAAHAGDAGRGFSVVADEIRRLADTSSKESRKIKNEILEVQSAIQEVVLATRNSEQAFTTISNGISETDALVKELHMAISEQHEGASQILEALRSMNDITAEVRTGSREMNSGSVIISDEMQHLLDSAQSVTENMDEIAKSVDHVSASSQTVSGIVATTKDAITEMESVVTQFKTR